MTAEGAIKVSEKDLPLLQRMPDLEPVPLDAELVRPCVGETAASSRAHTAKDKATFLHHVKMQQVFPGPLSGF